MRGLNAASVEAFDRRGLSAGLEPGAGRSRHVGHFAGLMLEADLVDESALPLRTGVMTSIEAIESLLAERAAALGVTVERGVAVSGVEQDGEHVVARAGDRAYAGRWLVGCDGGRSAVRGLAGFDFVGTEPQFTGYTMLVDLDDPRKLRPGFNVTPTGMYLRTPFDGHVGMHDFDGGAFDRSATPTRDHLQTVLRRVSGTDVTIRDVRLVSTYTDRAMQTTTYRRGRVLLAGDAAHIHSPLGGQGLNVGLGDAMNLGWKLAAVLRGDAPDDLLDTYTRERHPVGAWVLDWTRAQVAVMRPDPHAYAIRRVFGDLAGTRDGTTYLFGRMSGLSNRYDLGGTHPLVGRNAPDFRTGDGHLGDLLRDGRGVVLDFGSGLPLREQAKEWEGRIRYVAVPEGDGPAAVLVRPDGVVAWVDDQDPEGFAEAATRWFGRTGEERS
ncbi:MAG: FAD-dependent oxidoreductase [Nonomuraea sp.]|nr:FAD-dependent oxidoreductase [Nonomuraea sp.]